ncbi:MAG TPA: GNAT family N-acetyltransferase [Bryobacteraceae bacterium]|nr:GNAT family N-acetyltransferase [Bryobacteraceae bacterium]
MSSPAVSKPSVVSKGTASSKPIARLATGLELEKWDLLVARFPNKRTFHSSAWCRSVASLVSARPVFLVFETGGEIVGALPGYILRLGPLNVFGSPLEGSQTESMGPVFDPRRTSGPAIMAAAIDLLESEFNIHHIEIAGRDFDAGEMEALGFHSYPQFTYRAVLFPQDADKGFAKLNPKVRNRVRKCQRAGITVSVHTDMTAADEFVAECFDQTKEVFTRRGNAVPFSHKRMFACYEALAKTGDLLALNVKTDAGRSIATGLFSADGSELVLWMWTHRYDARLQSPTEFLTWTAMEHAAARGCSVFDMTGGGEAKRKFGGEPDQQTLRWIRSRYFWMPAARELARRAYRWQQRTRGQMRRALANRNVERVEQGAAD